MRDTLEHDTLDLGGLQAEITRKAIRHVHLSVLPPTGLVRVAAPAHVPLETIRLFVIAKLGWIRAQQRKLQAQAREAPRLYRSKESHQVWGRQRLLELHRVAARPEVRLTGRKLHLQVRPDADVVQCEAVLEAWFRQQLRAAVEPLLAQWEPVLGVKARQVHVQHMKTKWGSCSPVRQSIRLNTALVHKPLTCLEYIVVHELLHLLEPTHNQRFQDLLVRHLPQWQQWRQQLNRLPLRHEDWRY